MVDIKTPHQKLRSQVEETVSVFYIQTDNEDISWDHLGFYSTLEKAKEAAELFSKIDQLDGNDSYFYEAKETYLNQDLHMVRDRIRGYHENIEEGVVYTSTDIPQNTPLQIPEDFTVEFPDDLHPKYHPEFREYRYRLALAQDCNDPEPLHKWLNHELANSMETLPEAQELVDIVGLDLMRVLFQSYDKEQSEGREQDKEEWYFYHDLLNIVGFRRIFFRYFEGQQEMPQEVFYMISTNKNAYSDELVGVYSTFASAEEALALHKEIDQITRCDKGYEYVINWVECYLNVNLNILRGRAERPVP